VDEAGNVLETFDYYPFGLLMPKRNTAGANTLEKFTGHELDSEANLNLFYAGARYLDPAIGRWYSVDPKADDFPSFSPYNYTMNNPLNMVDPDGQAPLDDIYFDSETGTTDIVRTDEPDQLFVDGKRAGGTDVSFWEKGADIYDSYSNMFASKLGNQLLNESTYGKLMDGANRPEIRKGLFKAKIAVGSRETLTTMTKIGATGAAAISTFGIGTGAVAGSVALMETGAAIGTVGGALSAGESALKGNSTAAAVKGLTTIGFNSTYTGILGNSYSNVAERGIMSVETNIIEYITGISINAAEDK
jgi:RHS repeat-associated protein